MIMIDFFMFVDVLLLQDITPIKRIEHEQICEKIKSVEIRINSYLFDKDLSKYK